jgi:hypothetical protein
MPILSPPTWLAIAVLLGGCVLSIRGEAAEPAPQTAPWSGPGTVVAPYVQGSAVAPRLTIVSDTACPSGTAVAEALAALCPPSEWPSGAVRIRADADLLTVDLIADQSTHRQLQAAADCSLRATTVALVVATWTGELASDAAGVPLLRAPAPGVRGEASVTAPDRSPVDLPATERELGAGLLLAVSAGVAPGVRLDFVQTRSRRGLGWQADLTLPGRREKSAAGGSASWTRAAASVALKGRITLGRLALSASAGIAGAYTLTSGRGYSIEQGDEAITGGAVAGIRLAVPWRRMRVWTEVRGYRWLFPQSVAVDSITGSRVATVFLPSSDFHWAVGLSYLL